MLRTENSQPLQRLEKRQASAAGTIEIRSLEELKELVDKIPGRNRILGAAGGDHDQWMKRETD